MLSKLTYRWIFFYFYTFRMLCFLSEVIIRKPIHKTMSLFLGKKKESKMKENFDVVIQNKESGMNIDFAFSWMLFTTFMLYSLLFLLIKQVLTFEVQEMLIYYAIFLIILAFLTVNQFLRKSDVYLKHFSELEKRVRSSGFIFTFAFHFGVPLIFILVNYVFGYLDSVKLF